ncbi:MAG: D-alanyl-D-alanine carboxypeptidase [Flavitalea sp.]
MKRILFLMTLFITFISCSRYTAAVRKINEDEVLKNAHVGIAVVEVKKDRLKWRVNQNSERYFIPASNIKIVTLYAAMQHLPDSLAGLKYYEADTALYIRGTGDPSFLQPEFSRQPVMEFLKSNLKPVYMDSRNWNSNAFGTAWSWNDYNEYYMPERSVFPVFGNVIRWKQERGEGNDDSTDFDRSVFIYSTPEVNWDVRFNPAPDAKTFSVQRDQDKNAYTITQGKEQKAEEEIPFITNGVESALELLRDSIRIRQGFVVADYKGVVRSQLRDSLLRKMMERSDNFYAEQLVMMISDQLLGEMNDSKLRDSLLRTTFNFLPQKPRWADGSGLSRFNIFTPSDFVSLLDSLENKYGQQKLEKLFNRYKFTNGEAYAKSGTLTGVVALSGYYYSKKGKKFLFSFLVNNHRGNAGEIRKKIYEFLESL